MKNDDLDKLVINVPADPQKCLSQFRRTELEYSYAAAEFILALVGRKEAMDTRTPAQQLETNVAVCAAGFNFTRLAVERAALRLALALAGVNPDEEEVE